MINFWETKEPDFINELGIKWYFDVQVTDYCLKENLSGVSLTDIIAFVIVKPSGETERVLVKYPEGEVIFNTKSLEEIGVEIDKLKLIKTFASYEI